MVLVRVKVVNGTGEGGIDEGLRCIGEGGGG